MKKYVPLILIASACSHSAQLLQFGPITRIMKQNELEQYVALVMAAFWLGAGLTCLLTAKLLDSKKTRTALICSLPLSICPFGYLSTDYRVLLGTRFVQGLLISFLSVALMYQLRKLLPPMKEEATAKPANFQEMKLAWKSWWKQLWRNWRGVVTRAGDKHKMGIALDATMIALFGTLIFSTLGYEWINHGWPLIGWSSIASLLFLLSIGFAFATLKAEKENCGHDAPELTEEAEKTLTNTEKKQRRAELFFALIPGLGMGVVISVYATYLPLYSMVTVSVIMFIKRTSEVISVWFVAFLPSKWDQYTMLSGIFLTGTGVVVLWMDNGYLFLVISAVLLGLGTEAHRNTLSNDIFKKEKKKGLAVVIPFVAFNLACFTGSLWGALAGIVGYSSLWLTLLIWLVLPLSSLVWENRKRG